MYKRIAARRVRKLFDEIGRGNADALLAGVAPDVHHVFAGQNALGGERHSREAMRAWFERLYELFPELSFEVKRVAVKGPPWDLEVAVEWADRGRAADGEPYENEGAHWVRLRWGKGVYVHGYLDSDRVTAALERMSRAGIAAASAPQIVD